MNLIVKKTITFGFVLLIFLAMAVFFEWGYSEHVDGVQVVTANSEPVTQIKTVQLKKGQIQETITAYGMVLPLPDKLKSISVPYTSLVDKIQVNQGQIVQQGDPLLTLKPGSDAVLQLRQAESELTAALQENQLLQERIRLKLATQQDLVGSRLRLEQAKAMINNLADRGIGKEQQIKADSSGIIYLVSVQQGQIIAAGTPLLQLVDQNQWVVRLGIESEDYDHLKVDQRVLITPVNTHVTQPVTGRIEIITHQIDPSTRLLNVFVRPEQNQTLLINDFVEAKIVISTVNAFLVPRQAVLPDDGAYSLFTVENGRAVKHIVQVGLENDAEVEVIANDLKEQDYVVVLGNYELEPGMAVTLATEKSGAQGVGQ